MIPTWYDLQRNLLTVVLLLCSLFTLRAQDPHFTQYFSSPLLTNPALTGMFSGDYRVSSCYRNQWAAIQYPYATGSVGVDANAFKGYLNENDIAGIGVNGMFDNSNNGGLKTNQVAVSLSFHKALDMEGTHRLGVGFQGAFTTRNLDYTRFVFGQQLTPSGYNNSLPTGEPKNGFSTSYFDYSAGMLYSAMKEDKNYYLGAALYHINKPRETFDANVYKVSPRISVHAGGDFTSGEFNKLYWSGLYMKTENSQEITIGSVYGINLSPEEDESSLLLGAWYRYNDAIAPYVGLQYRNFQGGLSYDVNVSKLKVASQYQGGFELSLSILLSRNPDENKIPKCFNRF